MNQIVEKIREIPNLRSLKGCNTSQIMKAQQALDMVFPDEFIDYVKTYGVIRFWGTEWNGLNIDGPLNIVDATLQERQLDPNFPAKYFVLENQGMDGILTIVNEAGNVYLYQASQKRMICHSLSEYLDQCIARKGSN